MPKISRFSARDERYEYELSLSWDDKAFIDGNVSFRIDVVRRSLENRDDIMALDATVSIAANKEGQPLLIIKAQGKQVAEYKLRDLFDESQVIDMIPAWVYGAGEPITGCLLRSGLSVSVAQILSCRNQTAGVEWYLARMREIGACLLRAIPDMTASAARKAITCILRFGF